MNNLIYSIDKYTTLGYGLNKKDTDRKVTKFKYVGEKLILPISVFLSSTPTLAFPFCVDRECPCKTFQKEIFPDIYREKTIYSLQRTDDIRVMSEYYCDLCSCHVSGSCHKVLHVYFNKVDRRYDTFLVFREKALKTKDFNVLNIIFDLLQEPFKKTMLIKWKTTL